MLTPLLTWSLPTDQQRATGIVAAGYLRLSKRGRWADTKAAARDGTGTEGCVPSPDGGADDHGDQAEVVSHQHERGRDTDGVAQRNSELKAPAGEDRRSPHLPVRYLA